MGRVGRKTKQKEQLQEAIDAQDGFFSAHELAEESGVARATVYRYLKDAERRGDVHGYECGGQRIYTRELRSHCHFIDEETGRVQHFSLDDLGPIVKAAPGKACHVQVEVRGRFK